jgi:hypothetical protein
VHDVREQHLVEKSAQLPEWNIVEESRSEKKRLAAARRPLSALKDRGTSLLKVRLPMHAASGMPRSDLNRRPQKTQRARLPGARSKAEFKQFKDHNFYLVLSSSAC